MVSAVQELADLNGSELSSVCFVRDYVEFHFDGPILRSLASPLVHVGSAHYKFPGVGSRDVLCDLIGHLVEGADDLPDRLSLRFSGGTIVDIPKASDGAGAEVAHFVPTIEGKLDVASMVIWDNLLST
jgi:hypothetical protein